MLNNFLKMFFLSVCVVSVSACASLQHKQILSHRDTQYLSAVNLSPLKVPPGMAPLDTQTQMMIPVRQNSAASKKVNLIPPGL